MDKTALLRIAFFVFTTVAAVFFIELIYLAIARPIQRRRSINRRLGALDKGAAGEQVLNRLRAELIAGHEEFAREVAERYGAKEPDALFFSRCGLHKAAEWYQASGGYRFATYAVWWMRHAIVSKRTWERTKGALG